MDEQRSGLAWKQWPKDHSSDSRDWEQEKEKDWWQQDDAGWRSSGSSEWPKPNEKGWNHDLAGSSEWPELEEKPKKKSWNHDAAVDQSWRSSEWPGMERGQEKQLQPSWSHGKRKSQNKSTRIIY